MRFVTLLLSFAASAIIFAQEPPSFKKPTPKLPKESTSLPVTHIEAKKVLEKAILSLNKGIKLSIPMSLGFANDKNSVTKDEVLAVFRNILDAAENKFVRNPRPYKFKQERLRKDLANQYHELIRKGIVTPYGPLTTKGNGTLTPKEFGDITSFMMVRIIDLCHQPTQKFSPDLMRPGG
jgi:hypothetical protein